MASKLTIAVDVDEVCADLLSAWLNIYNDKVQNIGFHRLLPEDITSWNIAEFLPPEEVQMFYEILRQGDLYRHVYPIEGARAAVWKLRQMGHRVVFATACVPGTEESKRRWLEDWGFFAEMGHPTRDFCPLQDKSLVRADYLVDDRPENVQAFPGIGVLIDRAHNRSDPHPLRLRNLAAFPDWLTS